MSSHEIKPEQLEFDKKLTSLLKKLLEKVYKIYNQSDEAKHYIIIFQQNNNKVTVLFSFR